MEELFTAEEVDQTNPNGLELNFKLVQGWNFLPEGDWHK
jgi:hypothetical protein